MPDGASTLTDRFDHLVFLHDAELATTEPRPRQARPAARGGPAEPEPEPDPELAGLLGWLCARAGVNPEDYRASVFQRRSKSCLRAVRAASYAEARALAERSPEAGDRLLNALLVGVTSFFRDPGVFDALRPHLAASARPPTVLSVGCSAGCELYSCAIVLAELGLLGGATLVGFDCRPAAVRAARLGVYSGASVEHLPSHIVDRYFVPDDNGRVRVRDDLRAACSWRVGEAFSARAGRPADVVLCRNVAIYLEPHATLRLWERLHARLASGGLLVVGKAERPTASLFTRVGPCLFRRNGGDL